MKPVTDFEIEYENGENSGAVQSFATHLNLQLYSVAFISDLTLIYATAFDIVRVVLSEAAE